MVKYQGTVQLFEKSFCFIKRFVGKNKKTKPQSIKFMIENHPFAGNISALKFTCMFEKIGS